MKGFWEFLYMTALIVTFGLAFIAATQGAFDRGAYLMALAAVLLLLDRKGSKL